MFKKYWFIAAFFLTLIFPLYGGLLESNITLSGVTNTHEVVEANLSTLGDGTYQTYLNDCWETKFPGKKFLLRIRNQLLYSVFGVSPNSNVVIGKDNYLYEPGYIYWEIQAFPPSSEEYFDTLGANLAKLKNYLEENDKELYIFITPSKAHFCREYIPERLKYLNREGQYTCTNYKRLLEVLAENNIPYFDSVAFIEQNLDTGILKSPVFYKSGIHWNHTWGQTCAAEFLNYINMCSKYDLASVNIKETISEEPIAPDTDLYSSLNLLAAAKEQWYSTVFSIENQGNDHPNVFLRGGSFMGQSLNSLLRGDIFGENVHFENNYYYTDNYTSSKVLSSFTAYDEIDLDLLVGQTDILILEVNEGAIYTMGWGFIEYLLEHPDYLDRTY